MDTLSPTRERIAQAAYGVDEPEVTQTAQRRAYIVRDIWSDLYRRDQITAEERDAGQKFAAHLEMAYRGRSVTPSYGQRHAEGTPISQLSGHAAQTDAARVVDYVLLHRQAREALSQTARLAMLMACEGNTLTQIGRLIAKQSDPKKAQAAGVAYLKIALELLTSHYGMTRNGAS